MLPIISKNTPIAMPRSSNRLIRMSMIAKRLGTSSDIPMIATIVFQGNAFQGDIFITSIIYILTDIKTLLYKPYPVTLLISMPLFSEIYFPPWYPGLIFLY
jgi:hypothetical protein